jgi:L-asparaginase
LPVARPAAERPQVALVGTGGTISSVGRHSLDFVEYSDYGRILEADQLVGSIPEIKREADVLPVRFRTLPSSAITPRDWLHLSGLIHSLWADNPGVAGIVVTHGTSTLEETAYFLHLTLKVQTPVVLVGAQRPSNSMSSDASLNLLNAIRTSCSPAARGLGALVLLNDEIHCAREVTKTSNFRLEAFRAPDLGMLGYADADGEIVIYRRPTRRHTIDSEFDTGGLEDLPRVEIAYSYAGSDGTAIDAFVGAGARAVVLASLAPGRPTPGEIRAAAAARDQGVLMVLSSRAGSGRIPPRELAREQGFLEADNLNPQKTRVLTMLALTKTQDPAEMERMFREY